MPNIASAAKRVRQNKVRSTHNSNIKSRLKTLRKNFLTSIEGGKEEEITTALKDLTSSLHKAAKTGVIHKNAARRIQTRIAQKASAALAS